jgi:uncharacterized protein
MKFKVLNGLYSVCRLNKEDKIPNWVNKSIFYSITQTDDELSIVCYQENVPPSVKSEKDWKVIMIEEKLDFSLIGIISKISTLLAENNVSIFVISTFDTDYILVKQENFAKTVELLKQIGSMKL